MIKLWDIYNKIMPLGERVGINLDFCYQKPDGTKTNCIDEIVRALPKANLPEKVLQSFDKVTRNANFDLSPIGLYYSYCNLRYSMGDIFLLREPKKGLPREKFALLLLDAVLGENQLNFLETKKEYFLKDNTFEKTFKRNYEKEKFSIEQQILIIERKLSYCISEKDEISLKQKKTLLKKYIKHTLKIKSSGRKFIDNNNFFKNDFEGVMSYLGVKIALHENIDKEDIGYLSSFVSMGKKMQTKAGLQWTGFLVTA